MNFFAAVVVLITPLSSSSTTTQHTFHQFFFCWRIFSNWKKENLKKLKKQNREREGNIEKQKASLSVLVHRCRSNSEMDAKHQWKKNKNFFLWKKKKTFCTHFCVCVCNTSNKIYGKHNESNDGGSYAIKAESYLVF